MNSSKGATSEVVVKIVTEKWFEDLLPRLREGIAIVDKIISKIPIDFLLRIDQRSLFKIVREKFADTSDDRKIFQSFLVAQKILWRIAESLNDKLLNDQITIYNDEFGFNKTYREFVSSLIHEKKSRCSVSRYFKENNFS